MILGLFPDIGSLPKVLERLKVKVVIDQHTKQWDDVFSTKLKFYVATKPDKLSGRILNLGRLARVSVQEVQS
ncbi:hypothetical protein C2W62_38735 [Candidatus Entotheonella serta]|nr:hypothetical protein C2W62_38735 [Candidatus Entotheonella serta]